MFSEATVIGSISGLVLLGVGGAIGLIVTDTLVELVAIGASVANDKDTCYNG